jgi:hypothetical protein
MTTIKEEEKNKRLKAFLLGMGTMVAMLLILNAFWWATYFRVMGLIDFALVLVMTIAPLWITIWYLTLDS